MPCVSVYGDQLYTPIDGA